MASVQVNLKVPEAVRSAWQASAAAAGLSVRDWLISETTDRPAGLTLESLAARVEALERAGGPPAPRPAPRPAPADQPVLDLEGGADRPLFTRELARVLGRNPKALGNRATAGGLGTVVDGWEVVGQVQPPTGGPARWIWQRVEDG